MSYEPPLSYNQRLATFVGYWDDCPGTTRQLAAIGHVCDRPPLEALEAGSHCISCSAFVHKEKSIHALEGVVTSADHDEGTLAGNVVFHHPSCRHLQVRMPLDPTASLPGLYGGLVFSEMRAKWEKRFSQALGPRPCRPRDDPVDIGGWHGGQGHNGPGQRDKGLFTLPTEIRLQIYALVLPSMGTGMEIVALHNDSSRIATAAVFEKPGPRDMTRCNILGTCRAIHAEALAILFDQTTYRFGSTKLLYLFLRQVGRHGRRSLKAVDVLCGSREDAVAFALLASCEQLRSMVVRLPRPVLLLPRAPLWMVDGVTSLLNLSGLERVEFDDCGFATYMNDSRPDAAVVRREVMRVRGTEMSIEDVMGLVRSL